MSLEDPRSRWRQIADQLRAAIESGEYARGAWLPSEPELSARYGVSQPTVHQAMASLRAEGLVQVIRGRGTRVFPIPVIHAQRVNRLQRGARERGGAHGAFESEITALGLTPRWETAVTRDAAPASVATILGLDDGAAAPVVRRRRMWADDVPVQLADSWIPADIAEGTQIAEVDSGPGGIISRFAELGHAQVRITETVQVRRPTEEERTFLQLDQDQPVTSITRTGWTESGRAVEVIVSVVPANLWVLDYEWPIDQAGS